MGANQTQPTALITGAGTARIGNCVARTLAARGYHVAIHAHASIDAAQATVDSLTADGATAMAVQADVSDEQQVRAMVDRVVARFGYISAMAHCAAIWETHVLEDTTADDVRRHFDVNTLGTFLCCQQVGLQMVSQDDGGAIVTLGDWAVARPYGDYAAYFASKGSIPTLTRSFAVELARRNPRVRVNAVLPGPVLLPKDMPLVQKRAAIAGTLAKREGCAENVADAVTFLLENDYVTGVCLPVDGGRSIYSE